MEFLDQKNHKICSITQNDIFNFTDRHCVNVKKELTTKYHFAEKEAKQILRNFVQVKKTTLFAFSKSGHL